MLQTTSHSSIVDLSNPHCHNSVASSSVIIHTGSNKNELLDFKEGLYRNSKIHRIILGEHIRYSKLALNKWYIMNLKLVTEFGLPLQDMLPYKQMKELPITCRILQLQYGVNTVKRFVTSSTLKMEYRLYEEKDEWKIAYEEPPGVDDHISIQYRITCDDSLLQYQNHPDNVYIQIEPRKEATITRQHRALDNNNNNSELDKHQKALSLCLGPFQIIPKEEDVDQQNAREPLFLWDDYATKNLIKMYRALPLAIPNNYLLCQEIWDNGTPGKLWDSALAMISLFNIMMQMDKRFLSGKRILDLSAGTGAMGLSIAQNCRLYGVANPPRIVLTDLKEALPLMESNKALNCITDNVNIKRLVWGNNSDVQRVTGDRPFDYIFISDVLYNTIHFPALIATFRQLVHYNSNVTGNTVIIMGYKPRGLKKSEEDLFFNECRLYMDIEKMTEATFARLLSPEHNSHPFFTTSTILNDTGVCLYQITRKNCT